VVHLAETRNGRHLIMMHYGNCDIYYSYISGNSSTCEI